ncbi:hypothetical protein BHM03_00016430 [Ensete ventricosum]|nr:hypothetical protein BHM03_00016430 [Ensete ventricosum]
MYWSDHGLISPIGMARQSVLHATNLRKRGQDILIILLPFDEEHLAHALCRLFLLTQESHWNTFSASVRELYNLVCTLLQLGQEKACPLMEP